jgi:hypothetical protein
MAVEITSGLSGRPLAGSDDPTVVRMELPSRERFELTVSAEEASDLAQAGKPIAAGWATRLARFSRWFRANFTKIAAAGVALWVTSIVIPAVVQQWADRQKELELKTSLVTGISDAVADATSNGTVLNNRLLPELAVEARAAYRTRLAHSNAVKATSSGGTRITDDEQAEIDKAGDLFGTAEAAAIQADRKLSNETRSDWIKSSASAEARLRSYFESTALPNDFETYRTVLLTHLVLLQPRLAENTRNVNETKVLEYVCEGPNGVPLGVGDRVQIACTAFHETHTPPAASDYPWAYLASELLRLNDTKVGAIHDANADGFNVGRADLFRAIFGWNPFS